VELLAFGMVMNFEPSLLVYLDVGLTVGEGGGGCAAAAGGCWRWLPIFSALGLDGLSPCRDDDSNGCRDVGTCKVALGLETERATLELKSK